MERVTLTIIFIGLGVLIYRLIQWWNLYKINRRDPLLMSVIAGQPAIIYFTADYCATCRFQQKPVLTTLHAEGIQIIEVDVEKQQADASRWGVMSLPTTFVLDPQGKPQSVNYGVVSAQKLRQQLERAYGNQSNYR